VPCDEVLHDRSLVTGEPVVSVHADLSPTLRAAGQARALIASVLNGAGTRTLDDDLVHSAQLVGSELVTNAVLHARSELHLGICHDEHALLIAVADGAPLPVAGGAGSAAVTQPSEADATDPAIKMAAENESGRGMLIVASLAADFGWRSRQDLSGKIMWVLLDLDLDDRPQTSLT